LCTDDLTVHHRTGLDRRGSRNIHAVVGLDVSALTLDTVSPAEQPLVMVGRWLRLSTGSRVARLIIAERGRHHRSRNGERQATKTQEQTSMETH
jgi:hypothetical protein